MSITDDTLLSEYISIKNGDGFASLTGVEKINLLNKIDEMQRRVSGIGETSHVNVGGNLSQFNVG